MDALVQRNHDNEYLVPASESRLPSPDVRESVPEFEESVDLRDYLDVVLRRKWLVLTFLLGVFITTLIVSLVMKPVFKAEGRVDVNLQAPKVTKFEDVVGSQLQTREYIQTQVKLLQSTSLAQRVIEKLQLEKQLFPKSPTEETADDNKPGILQQAKETIKGWVRSGKKEDTENNDKIDISRLRLARATEGKFKSLLDIQPQRDTTIINIAFSSTNPALARDVVNTLIQEFIGWRMDNRLDSAKTAKQQLEKQIDIVRIALEKSEDALNKFAQQAGIVSLDANLNGTYLQLQQINQALAAAQTDRIAKESIYQQVLDGDISSLPQVASDPVIQQLQVTYINALAQYQQDAVTYKDDYPKQKVMKAKLQDLQDKITAAERNVANSVKKQYLASLKTEQSLKEDAEQKKAQALALNDRATQYKILEREVNTNKQIYESLLQRSKEIDANVGSDITNVQVVDYAILPISPYKPNVKLNLLLAVVIGLMGGVGLAFFLEYMDNTIKRIDEISDRFQIPLLGVLPAAREDELADLDFLVRQKPKAGFSEAVRTAKVSIQLSSSMDQPSRMILMTSTTAGEGKSTVACNLAQAFASSEEKVVILDCDLRKPRLHHTFHTNGKTKGISHFLSGMCKASDIVNRTEVPNLDFVCAGPLPPNPAELLASNRMKQLLAALSKCYDRIIIDGPPAAGFADVLILGNYVDGVILVSTLGKTHRESLRIFRKSLSNVRGHLLGGVVNKLNVGSHYGGYYYKYYKYYKYYHYSYRPYGDNKADSLPEAESKAAERELEVQKP